MNQLLSLLDGALQQGLTFGIGAAGVAVALRSLKYPDLTADGSFLIGGTGFGAMLQAGMGWPVALAGAVALGGAAGLFTGAIHQRAKVGRLLSGILTSMICYSVAFWLLDGRPNVSLGDLATPFSWAAGFDRSGGATGGVQWASIGTGLVWIAGVGLLLTILLRSQWGMVLRATGHDSRIVAGFGRSPGRYQLAGLALANALVALSGALVSARQGFADVNMGPGSIVIFIASLVLGEQLARRFMPARSEETLGRVVAAVAGCIVYYAAFLTILRLSLGGYLPMMVRPTDLKLISAVLIIAVIYARARRAGSAEEILPL